jgi:hypothetical protein
MRLLGRLLPARLRPRRTPRPGPQGEEHEILVNERERRRVNDLFGARMLRKGQTEFLDEDLNDP